MTDTEEKPQFSCEKGWIYPLGYRVFQILKWVSPLNWLLKANKGWIDSRRVVDTYVASWVCVSISIFCVLQWGDMSVIPILSVVLTILLALRLFDILQAWVKTLFIPPFAKSSAPRLIILALLNYIEVTIIFGVIGFLFRLAPYYEQTEKYSHIQAIDGLRASFGIVTPLGVGDLPSAFTSGALYYVEYVIGLLFLLIIINRVLGYFRNN